MAPATLHHASPPIPIQLTLMADHYSKLKDAVEGMEDDFSKFYDKGNKAAGTRIRKLSDAVDILRALLAGDEVNVDSEFYSVSGSLSAPLPVQQGGIPLMLAGGKQKMLTLAGQKADIVGFNPGLSAGVIDERAGRTATAEKTDEKLTWIRDGAGDRLDSIELQTRIHLTMITDDRDKVAAEMAPLLGISPEEALESPHALVGTTQQCIDEVQRWRDRWGISFVSINGQDMEAFAPVVEALAGK